VNTFCYVSSIYLNTSYNNVENKHQAIILLWKLIGVKLWVEFFPQILNLIN